VAFAQQLYGADLSVRLDEAVQARVKDPLWFLARQWQVGEFAAENGGGPASASIDWNEFALRTLHRTGPDEAAAPEQLNLDAPLEWAVEREDPSGDSRAWRAEALEHGFELQTASHTMRATEYTGPTLDWFSVDLSATAAGAPTGTGTRRAVPTQLVVPGAPHPRWWRLEDPDTYLDSPNDPEPNVLSLLLPELAYVDVNDWYLVPLGQRAGTLRQITAVSVVDSFGIVTTVPPFDADGWRVFTLAAADGVDPAAAVDLLFVPNIAIGIVDNDEVEDVRFLPDEHANVVWAIEQAYRDASGDLVRDGGPLPPAAPLDTSTEPAADAEETGALPQFRFAAPPPPAWIPYLPRTARPPAGGGPVDTYLRRGRTDPHATASEPQYRTRIVAEAWRINEHEIPPAGVRIRRIHRYARGSDGRAFFWIGRRAEPTPSVVLPRTAFDFLTTTPR